MKVYDISMPIHEEMAVYKNREEKRPRITTVTSDEVTESKLQLDVHAGTHLDAPLHMMPQAPGIETYSAERFLSSCLVLDFYEIESRISKRDLKAKNIFSGDFVLLKTRNSLEEKFNSNFIYLDAEGAEFLAGLNINGVGIDALGIERSQQGHPTHKILFDSGVMILEGLRLENVPEGRYFLILAPLCLAGTDAAPARALLVKSEKQQYNCLLPRDF